MDASSWIYLSAEPILMRQQAIMDQAQEPERISPTIGAIGKINRVASAVIGDCFGAGD